MNKRVIHEIIKNKQVFSENAEYNGLGETIYGGNKLYIVKPEILTEERLYSLELFLKNNGYKIIECKITKHIGEITFYYMIIYLECI